MKESKIKLNSGCIKIFKFLSLLYEDKADYDAVCSIFKEDISQTDNNIQVVLNKYLNALKVFGIKVLKKKNKFVMENSLYSFPFDFEDLKSINLLSDTCNAFPDSEAVQNLKKLLKNIMIRMNNEDRNKMDVIFNRHDFSFYYSDLRSQIEQCEKICKNDYIVDVVYIKNNKEHKCSCKPKEVIYDFKQAYLVAYDIHKNEKLEIPLPNIMSLVELPQKSNSSELPTTVVFKLKGPLAKIYKLKENEYTLNFEKDGSQVVVNKDEPFDKLFSRLMRYGKNCEIISPKFLRNEFISIIDKMLNNYSN